MCLSTSALFAQGPNLYHSSTQMAGFWSPLVKKKTETGTNEADQRPIFFFPSKTIRTVVGEKQSKSNKLKKTIKSSMSNLTGYFTGLPIYMLRCCYTCFEMQ